MLEPLSAQEDRELSLADLTSAQEKNNPVGSKPEPLQNIRQHHHHIARLIASGAPDAEISQITGMHPSRISILKSDASFQELIAFYAEREDARFADFQEQLATLGQISASELIGRLQEQPDDMSTNQILSILQASADRSGHGPKQSVDHTHSIDKDTLDGVKEAASKREKGRVVSRDTGSDLGSDGEGRTLEGEAKEIKGGEGEGSDV